MFIQGMRARRLSVSLYRRVTAVVIPPRSCIFPVINRKTPRVGDVEQPLLVAAVIWSIPVNATSRTPKDGSAAMNASSKPSANASPATASSEILAVHIDWPRAAVPFSRATPPALTRPFPPCRLPALAALRETLFS
jgi:hypothetical protein